MIRLNRGAEPVTLTINKTAWLQALNAATTPESRKKAESKYRKESIKRALATLCNQKCAYCESKILHVDYGDIEHFRPKSNPLYRNLTFEWTNLLLSCTVCNGSKFKGTQFPDANQGGPPIDPSTEEPGDHLTFFFDWVAGVATVLPRNQRGRVTRDLFGLNRPELRAHRSTFVKKLAALKRLGQQDQAALDLLDQAASAAGEYSAFARTILATNI